jgi:translation initiation factor IF-2
MRVYELAKEYNVTSKEIIETLNANGENVKSHLSGLSNDQIVKLGYIMQSGDTIVETEYKEELSEDDDYDEKGPIDFDEEAAKENGTELSMEPEKDDWTLGSGDVVVEGDKIGIDPEKIQEAVESNVKAAADAREKYAETVDAITKDPEGWANLNVTEDWYPDKNDGQLDEEETDSELSFGQKAFAKAKAEETTDEIKEVIVERPTGFFGWFKGLFGG